MKKRQSPKTRREPLTPQSLRDIRGGIGTWPTPERPRFFGWTPIGPLSIDSVPLPE